MGKILKWYPSVAELNYGAFPSQFWYSREEVRSRQEFQCRILADSVTLWPRSSSHKWNTLCQHWGMGMEARPGPWLHHEELCDHGRVTSTYCLQFLLSRGSDGPSERIRQGWGIWTFNRLVHKTFLVCICQPKQEVVWNMLCAAVRSSSQRGTQGHNPHPQPFRFWAEMTVNKIMGNLAEIGQFWK